MAILKNNRQKGMTIIEMLAVFIVIALLLSVVFLNYRQNQRQIVLDSAAYKLASDIRKQQSISGLDDTTCSKSNYQYSYGVHLEEAETGKYELFSDCDGSNTHGSPPDNLVEVVLPGDVELESISPSAGGVLDILFYPPGPYLVINDNPANESATIVIRLKSNVAIKKFITVNKAGMIDID